MALYKPIRRDDDVTTSYHRILYLTQTVNKHNSIAVVSYIDGESREKDLASNGDKRPYRYSATYETSYDESMNIEKAYEYLKTLPQFENAEDV